MRNRPEYVVKFYEAMTVPAMLYEGESWTIYKPSCNVIQTVEIEFIRKLNGAMVLTE
jgi:hypothetical protein